MNIVERPCPPAALAALGAAGVDPVIARLLAARGVSSSDELRPQLAGLLPPGGLRGLAEGAALLADAIERREPMLIVADYDCDGATACAVMMRGLAMFGARVDYLVPNRFEHGYGLTEAIVELACRHPRLGKPAIIVTVDNGIASVAGIARAAALGIRVLVTDHHLPGAELPAAAAIVNPNQPGCGFASKHLAGVGAAFYLLLGLRTELRSRGRFAGAQEPPLQTLLDLVALGTVADLVKLDSNNRILVAAGLKRIRAGRACEGVRALLAVAGRESGRLGTADLGFAVGPRINAAGRLSDISLGIECLLTDDPARAFELARLLDGINRERRDREARMRADAMLDVAGFDHGNRWSAVVHRPDWHEGVVGLVASRLKDHLHRPVFAFAPSTGMPGELRGSGRSIPGIHLRDTLDLVTKREPGLIPRYGGHAMAAGLSLPADRLPVFEAALEAAVRELADADCFRPHLLTDGPLPAERMSLALVEQLEALVWGQGFPEPVFSDLFEVRAQRLVKERHLRLTLGCGNRTLGAIWFDRIEPLPPRCRLAYRLARDDYGSPPTVQLMIMGGG